MKFLHETAKSLHETANIMLTVMLILLLKLKIATLLKVIQATSVTAVIVSVA